MAASRNRLSAEMAGDGLSALRVLLPGTLPAADRRGPFDRAPFRLALVVAVVVAYAFLSFSLAPSLGPSVGVLAVLPVTVGGLMFGVRGGALAGLAAIPANSVLVNLAGAAENGVIIAVSDLPAAAALVVAGGLIGKLRDLSARIASQLEDRLVAHDEVGRLSRQNYLLLNAVGEGVCGVDLEGTATFVNNAASRMLGSGPDELVGRPFADFFRTSPIDGTGERLTMEALTSGLRPGEVMVMLERQHGSTPVEVISQPVLDERSVLTGAVVTFRDVSPRVQARTIVENLMDAITITVGGRRVFANPAFLRIFGVPDEASALRIPIGGIVVEEEREEVLRKKAAFLSGEEPPGMLSYHSRRADGEVRSIQATLVMIYYHGERALLQLLRDVTEQHEAEADAKASDERFRAMFEGAAEGVATLDLDGRLIDANPAFLEKLGYEAGDIEGKTLRSLTNSGDLAVADERWGQLLGGAQHTQGERRFLRKDGSVLWGDVTGTLVREPSGAPAFGFVMVEDVTERKEALDALRESEANWRSLVQDAPTFIMNVTREGKLLFTNRGVPGLEPEELVGTSVYDYIPPEQHALIASALDRVFVTGEPDSYEMQGQLPDGEIAWYVGRLNPVVHDGVVVAATLLSIDVTDLKSAEENAQNRSAELGALLAISDALAQPGTLEARVEAALKHVTDAAGTDLAVLRVADGENLRIVGIEAEGDNGSELLELLNTGGHFAQGGLNNGVPTVVNDLPEHPNARPGFLAKGFKSVAALPIKMEGQVLGVLTVSSREYGFFNREREKLLAGITDVVAAHLYNAQLVAAERQRTRQVEAQFNIARILATADTFEEKTVEVLRELAAITEGDWLGLGLPDFSEQGIRFVVAGEAGDNLAPLMSTVPFSDPLIGAAWREGRPVVVRDGAETGHGSGIPGGNEMRSSVAVPVMGGGETLGVLSVSSEEPGHFTPDVVSFLAAIGEGMGTLVEHARLYQEITNQLEEGKSRLEAFRAAASRLALEADPDQALDHLLDVATSVVDAEYGVVAVWRGDSRRPTLIAQGARSPAAPPKAVLDALQLAREQAGTVRFDGHFPNTDAPVIGGRGGLGGALCVPFYCKDGQTGALAVFGAHDKHGFTEGDERHLSLFSALTGIMLDNIRLYGAQAQERGTLTAIQTSMTEGLVVLDPYGKVRYYNEAAELLIGVPVKRVAGKRFAEFIAKRSDIFQNPGEVSELAALIGDQDAVPVTITLTLSRPEHREVGITLFPIASGRDERMMGMLLRDVTEERELERRRDTFVSVASHELRTPMTTILGFSELLLTREPSPEVRDSWLRLIHQDSKQVTAIVDDMLNVARIQSGHMLVEPENVDVLEVAKEVTEGLCGTTLAHALNVEINGAHPCAMADRFKLAQVLGNLLENAVKYTPGGGTVTIRAVTDQGIGISPEDSERLFTTFHRIRRLETEKIRGTGLGLYIVKALVELMGGEVWLASRLNEGTTFFFSLPMIVQGDLQSRRAVAVLDG